MVHRPSDSRLLVNLLSHEKDYAKQLEALLDSSHASLASFSAYAASSAPPSSQIIIQVAGALASADDALRKYAESLQHWQDQLKSLKRLEDDVANIMRDREILVTRLIKVSKQKSSSQGLIPSSSSSTVSTARARSEVPLPAKLSAAQSELQACEAHLASKERELAAMRTAAVRRGLSVRCTALAECGQAWTAMGTEALRSLGTLEADAPVMNGFGNGDANTQPQEYQYRRPILENGDGPASDLSSSLGPSQSASQTTHPLSDSIPPSASYRQSQRSSVPSMAIPPAHAISDDGTFAWPYSASRDDASDSSRVDGSGSSDEEERQYEVHENTPFKTNGSAVSAPVPLSGGKHARFPFNSASRSSPVAESKSKTRQRRGSMLGSIAAFFHSSPSHRRHASASPAVDLSPPSSPSFSKRGSGWQTRTDRNIMRAGRDDSDDELHLRNNRIVMPPSMIEPIPESQGSTRNGTTKSAMGSQQRLKKRSTASPKMKGERGWASDGGGVGAGVVRSDSKATTNTATSSVRKKKAKAQPKETVPPLPLQTKAPAPAPLQPAPKPETRPVQPPSSPKEKVTLKDPPKSPRIVKDTANDSPSLSPQDVFTGKKPSGSMLPSGLPTEASISRSPSMSKGSHALLLSTSVAGIASQPNPTMHLASSHPQGQTSAHKRSVSMDSGKSGRKTSGSQAHPETSVSLMSVVEGMAEGGKKARMEHKHKSWSTDANANLNPNATLFIARAPPPVTTTIDYNELVRPADMTREASERSVPSVPLTPSIPAPQEPIKHVPSPQLKPLRSAMRNSSRSPSPNANMIALPPPPTIPTRSKLRPSPQIASVPLPPVDSSSTPVNGVLLQPALGPQSNGNTARNSISSLSSISSYETTREMFDDDYFKNAAVTTPSPLSLTPPPAAIATPPSPSPPPPPPKPINGSKEVFGSETSQSTSTISTGTQPTRRKSVRMSLPPTFSATPPALDDDTDGERHAPWAPSDSKSHHERHADPAKSNGWSSKIREPAEHDVWQDSSDEDEEYSRAKRLLSKASKKSMKRRG